MNTNQQNERDRVKGLGGFKLTREEAASPLWQRFNAAVEEELVIKRIHNDDALDIARTTVLRGEIALLKRISARTREVGPESRQSEPQWPESASGPVAGAINLR